MGRSTSSGPWPSPSPESSRRTCPHGTGSRALADGRASPPAAKEHVQASAPPLRLQERASERRQDRPPRSHHMHPCLIGRFLYQALQSWPQVVLPPGLYQPTPTIMYRRAGSLRQPCGHIMFLPGRYQAPRACNGCHVVPL